MTRPAGEHLSDVEVDDIVNAMLARARIAGQSIEEWIESEYRRVTPWWRRLVHAVHLRWQR